MVLFFWYFISIIAIVFIALWLLPSVLEIGTVLGSWFAEHATFSTFLVYLLPAMIVVGLVMRIKEQHHAR